MSRSAPSLAVLRLVFLGVVLCAVGIGLVLMGTDEVGDRLQEALDSRWGIAAFIALYAIAVALLMPGTIGSVASGVGLGFAVGFPVAMVSALLGATIAFFVARFLGREGSQELLGGRLMSVDDWIGENDFVSIVTLRLMPIVPFNLLNYGAGLTAVRPSRYIAGSAIGMLPGTGLTTFAASRADDPSSSAFVIATAALLATVVISTYVARRFTRSRSAAAEL